MVKESVRLRYLQDSLPTRLGGLAADLARVASCAEDSRDHDAVASLLEESKYFAEWAAPDAPLDVQEFLAQAQIRLAIWHRQWLGGRPDSHMREQAQQWSDQLLALAGLI